MAYVSSRVIRFDPRHLGEIAPATFNCFFYGESCTSYHVVPVPVAAGIVSPYTPDDLRTEMWLQKDQANISGVFDGLRRFTHDLLSPDGVMESFTFFWERTNHFDNINCVISNILLEDHSRAAPWRGVALMVKHRGSVVVDIDETDEYRAKMVIHRFVVSL